MSGNNSGRDRLDPGNTPSGISAVTRAPTRGKGVRKVNRVPIIIGGGVAGVVLLTVLYTAHHKSVQNQQAAADQVEQGAASTTPTEEFRHPTKRAGIDVPGTGAGTAPGAVQKAPPAVAPALVNQATPPSPYAQQWQLYTEEMEQLRQQRAQQLNAALTDETIVKGTEQASGTGAGAAQTAGRPTDSDYLASYRTGARNALEVKQGTVIPATLIAGINSDVAGMLKAQVRENVYDSATGARVLIPQGSSIIGSFNRSVGYGQERIEVAFNRIIFPDQSSIDLGDMEGADMSGNAGFADQVDNHWWKVMGNAVLAAAFGAGVQLSQNSNTFGGGSSSSNGLSGGYNAQQIIAAQLGQQTGELGLEIARRGLQIPPTITIRPGYEFNVMVRKDMILPAYQDGFGNGTVHSVADR